MWQIFVFKFRMEEGSVLCGSPDQGVRRVEDRLLALSLWRLHRCSSCRASLMHGSCDTFHSKESLLLKGLKHSR